MKRLLILLALPLAACSIFDSEKTPKTHGPDSGDISYICDSGQKIHLTYKRNGLSLRYKEKTYHLRVAISGSGARYVGDGLVWWNKGENNTLYKAIDNADTGEKIETCLELRHTR